MTLALVSGVFAQTPVTLNAPTGVTASDGAYAAKIALTWDAVPRATSYRIFRSTVNDATTATALGVTSSWVYWDTTTPGGQIFFYWVRAETAVAQSALGGGDSGFRANLTVAANGVTLEPPPEPAGNPTTAAKVALGKALFWDEQLSSTKTVACGTCHLPEKGGVDARSILGSARSRHPGADGIPGTPDDVTGSPGVLLSGADGLYQWIAGRGFQEQVTSRIARSAADAGYSAELFWDGRASGTFRDPVTNAVVLPSGGALESQSVGPILNSTEMAHVGRTWADVTARLATAWPLALASNIPAGLGNWIAGRTYPELFADAFGSAEITPVRIAFALASYERTLFSDRTPFDEANAGIRARPAAAARGLNTFNNETCATCHTGVTFSDGLFHHLGVRPVGAPEDAGRFDATGVAADRGKFLTPGLRNVALRGPFLHNGSLATLDDVMRFYDDGGNFNSAANEIRGINLNAGERSDLVAFLQTLTDPRLSARQYPFDRPTLFSESNRLPVVSGAGVAGSGVAVPAAIAMEPPLLGNPGFTLAVQGAFGGASAVLVIDTMEPPLDRIPTAAEVLSRFSLVLEGSGAGNGRASVHWPVPVQQALAGTRYFARWYVLDPAAPGGIAASARVAFTLFGEHGEPSAATTDGNAWLAGVSSRAAAGGIAGTPITGIVVTGGSKRILARVAGPALSGFGITNALAAPSFDLVQNGATIGSATGWSAADAAAFSAVGAFPFAANSRDAALMTTLPTGSTTAVVRAADGGTGVALLEAYDADPDTASSRLANLSTRAFVGTGTDVLIGGFTVRGTGELTLLVRAIGPGLAPFGVTNPLVDPRLTLYRSDVALATNDDWGNAATAGTVQTAATRSGAFALAADSKDSALVVTLPAGNYTAVVTASDGSTGTALLEIFVVPQ